MRKERILIVDDDKAVRESLASILEGEGYTVDAARTGREAWEKFQRKHHNLVLVNYRLPDMTSEQLQTKLASAPKTKVVMMKADLFKPKKLLEIIKEKLQ